MIPICSYPKIIGYFHSLSDALEVKARTMSVNEKITYAAEVGLSTGSMFICILCILTVYYSGTICSATSPHGGTPALIIRSLKFGN